MKTYLIAGGNANAAIFTKNLVDYGSLFANFCPPFDRDSNENTFAEGEFR
jgi:hypothetical protein